MPSIFHGGLMLALFAQYVTLKPKEGQSLTSMVHFATQDGLIPKQHESGNIDWRSAGGISVSG
jgi:hypothetical protein